MSSRVAVAGEKHALLIGIDRYPKLDETRWLKGCVNDALLLKRVLEERFAFSSEGIVLLENEKATRDTILESLQSLARRVGPEDLVVVSYSGHGSRMRTGGPTGWSESILPYDSGRGDHPNRDILDDEIHEWLLAMAAVTPNITLIFDSCFSGGIARDPFEGRVRSVPEDHRPTPGLCNCRDVGREASGWRALGSRYTLIAGCRFDETAREIQLDQGGGDILHHGALTYFFCRELRRAGREASSRDIFERAAASITALCPTQHPSLEGAREREPFGSRIFDTMPFLPVQSRRDNRALLAGGAAHGLTVGSHWEVYPQGTHEVTPETPSLGRLKVLSVRAVTAEVAIEEEPGPRPLEPGDRAVETAHDYGEMHLMVEICGPPFAASEMADLSRAIQGSRLLRLAEPGERGDVRVYLIPPRSEVRDGDPVPGLGPVQAPLWVTIGPDGSHLSPTLPAGLAGSLERLIANLEVRARHSLVLRIENPDSKSRLRDRIEATLMRWSGREWTPAEPDANGMVLFEDEEPFDIRITNRSDRGVFIHVLGLGLTGQIELLFPVEGALDPLQPRNTFRVNEKNGQDLQLYIPQAFPFENPGRSVVGIQHLKILATVEQADFSLLVQNGAKYLASEQGTRPFKSPLEILLASALTGSGRRETRPVQNALEDDWTAVTRSLLIRRP